MLFKAIKDEIENIDQIKKKLDKVVLDAREAMRNKNIDQMVGMYQKLKAVTSRNETLINN